MASFLKQTGRFLKELFENNAVRSEPVPQGGFGETEADYSSLPPAIHDELHQKDPNRYKSTNEIYTSTFK